MQDNIKFRGLKYNLFFVVIVGEDVGSSILFEDRQ